MDDYSRLQVGVESFEEIRRRGFYFVDKTQLKENLLDDWGKVCLFTLPGRFGKTLNMSMLRSFFELGADASLFAKNRKLCSLHMGSYPVISLTFKDIEGTRFETARNKLVEAIALEAGRYSFILDGGRLSSTDRKRFNAVSNHDGTRFVMDDDVLASSLKTLSELLYRHFGRKAVILIDEYDVPPGKAYCNGYYDRMTEVIRFIFSYALKGNDALDFAVLTGCLRVSKESIFTGLNNFRVLSITDDRFDEEFGFTGDEVEKMLEYYHLESHMDEIKEWYDDYRFGSADIYCPWDVINHAGRLSRDSKAEPGACWEGGIREWKKAV